MALNLWSMGYPSRHDRAWKCTSQNIILKRSEPQQRPSSAFFESFRSLKRELKSVKHRIYSYIPNKEVLYIVYLIVSPPTVDDLRKVQRQSSRSLRRSQCRNAEGSEAVRELSRTVGGCSRFGEVDPIRRKSHEL